MYSEGKSHINEFGTSMQIPPFKHGLGQQPAIISEQFSPLVNDGHRHEKLLPLSTHVPPFWQGLGSQLDLTTVQTIPYFSSKLTCLIHYRYKILIYERKS